MVRRLLRAAGVSVALMAVLTVVLGIVYPLAMTGAAQTLFPDRAEGSLVRVDGEVVGSELAAQPFTADAYFLPRPSATGWNPAATSFANLGPNSRTLADEVDARVREILRREGRYRPGLRSTDIPVDMVTTSGSGIDPHITVANAALQADRVAAERGLRRAAVIDIVRLATTDRFAGFLGEPGVNVLRANILLDQAAGAPQRP
jgi:K+-transporting ATPase ATPase C chain